MQKPDFLDVLRLPERPFLKGVARLFDFTGSLDRGQRERVLAYYERERKALEAEYVALEQENLKPGHIRDAEAIAADWRAVGDSLRWAIDVYERERRDENQV